MKTMSARQLQQRVRDCLDSAQKERVVITRHGRPAAVVVGVEGKDWETVLLETSDSLCKKIQERRKQTALSDEEFQEKLTPRRVDGFLHSCRRQR